MEGAWHCLSCRVQLPSQNTGIAGTWCFRVFWRLETSPVCTERYLWHSHLAPHGDQSCAGSRPFHRSVQRALEAGTGCGSFFVPLSPSFLMFYVIRAALGTDFELNFCLTALSRALVWAEHPPGPRCFLRAGGSQNLPREPRGSGRERARCSSGSGHRVAAPHRACERRPLPQIPKFVKSPNSSNPQIPEIPKFPKSLNSSKPHGKAQSFILPFRNERGAVSFR